MREIVPKIRLRQYRGQTTLGEGPERVKPAQSFSKGQKSREKGRIVSELSSGDGITQEMPKEGRTYKESGEGGKAIIGES